MKKLLAVVVLLSLFSCKNTETKPVTTTEDTVQIDKYYDINHSEIK